MLRHCQKCARFFVAAGLTCIICGEIARSITERSDMGEVTLYVAGPTHAPDQPHVPDNEPSAPLPSGTIMIRASTSSAVPARDWTLVPISIASSTPLWWRPPYISQPST
jgi:hypothetical protein